MDEGLVAVARRHGLLEALVEEDADLRGRYIKAARSLETLGLSLPEGWGQNEDEASDSDSTPPRDHWINREGDLSSASATDDEEETESSTSSTHAA